jgi:VanZ family protein
LRVRRWLPPLLWAGVILVGTSLPQEAVPLQTSKIDKVLHFSIYSVFAFLLTRLLLETNPRWAAVVIAVVSIMAFGAMDEWHQSLIPGRSTELADWFADSLGAAVGAIVALLWAERKRRSPSHPAP